MSVKMRQLLPFSIMLAVVFVLADEPGSRYEDLTDVDGNEVARMESEVKQSAQTLDIIPGFSPTGRRTNYTYHEGSDEVECAISYSALGEHTEPWRFTIRRSPWSWACIIESPPGSKLKFSFYSITFSGGGSSPRIDSVEVWGPEGVLTRDEHFVLPHGVQLRNAAGWVSGLMKVSLSRPRTDNEEYPSNRVRMSKQEREEEEQLKRRRDGWARNAQRLAERKRIEEERERQRVDDERERVTMQ